MRFPRQWPYSLVKANHLPSQSLRMARKQIWGTFSKEIQSLKPCLEALQQPHLIRFYADALRPNLTTIIRDCDGIASKISGLLSKLSSASSGRRRQWSFYARDKADRLRWRLISPLYRSMSVVHLGLCEVSLSAQRSFCEQAHFAQIRLHCFSNR